MYLHFQPSVQHISFIPMSDDDLLMSLICKSVMSWRFNIFRYNSFERIYCLIGNRVNISVCSKNLILKSSFKLRTASGDYFQLLIYYMILLIYLFLFCHFIKCQKCSILLSWPKIKFYFCERNQRKLISYIYGISYIMVFWCDVSFKAAPISVSCPIAITLTSTIVMLVFCMLPPTKV